MDERLQELMQRLGNAINESLSDSEGIADVIGEIKRAGYDVFLVLEATIGFNKKPAGVGAEEVRGQRPKKLPIKIALTPKDKDLLGKMHIIMPEDDDSDKNKGNG